MRHMPTSFAGGRSRAWPQTEPCWTQPMWCRTPVPVQSSRLLLVSVQAPSLPIACRAPVPATLASPFECSSSRFGQLTPFTQLLPQLLRIGRIALHLVFPMVRRIVKLVVVPLVAQVRLCNAFMRLDLGCTGAVPI